MSLAYEAWSTGASINIDVFEPTIFVKSSWFEDAFPYFDIFTENHGPFLEAHCNPDKKMADPSPVTAP